jgi:hypothetical protein
MKKFRIIFIGISILFLGLGVTYLNFDNLSLQVNYKGYILILLGICTLVFSFLKPVHLNLKE